VVGPAEHPFDRRAAAAAAQDGEIPRVCIPQPLAVDQQRDARRENRLADDVLAAPRELDDDAIRQVRP
jgi:hypothetical protein